MHTHLTQRQNLTFVIYIITFFILLTYLIYAIDPSTDLLQTSLDTDSPYAISPQPLPLPLPPNRPAIPFACQAVDYQWLASDRYHWDGWESKAMFMAPDGSYTESDIKISSGGSICIVVLLGPVPASSMVRPERHFGPSDSIVMKAVGRQSKLEISLQQSPQRTNVYFASITLSYPDTFYLQSVTEYRSYFWETPIYHAYRPFSFRSINRLKVTPTESEKSALSPCDARRPEHLQGSWQANIRLDSIQSSTANISSPKDNYTFVPDLCHRPFRHRPANECPKFQAIHVWGDDHVKRNLRMLANPLWCKESPRAHCVCNEDSTNKADWENSSIDPLVLNTSTAGSTSFYFNQIGSITLKDWRKEITQQAAILPPANVVILGLGNIDIALSRMLPSQFDASFHDVLNHIVNRVYPHQIIIVKTPQYFGHAILQNSAWNAGRSLAFSMIIEQAVRSMGDRVLLWNVRQLGMQDMTCSSSGTAYTKSSLVPLENELLSSLICIHKQL
ncbi:hypothetical protein CLU79DRAFT_732548 [Phycomyces nitens]|nr:hypothetical protein CLU79DRAFT_732548 [Phycomyces nitens]